MSAADFVTVNTAGAPEAHPDLESAVAAHLFNVGGAWNLWGDIRPAVLADLAQRRESFFEYVRLDTSPRFAAIFDNRADKLPLHRFNNRHLSRRENSVAYLAGALAARDAIAGPRIGDYCRRLDGSESRFTVGWGDDLQTGGGAGSYHLGRYGGASYSGGCGPAVPGNRLRATGEIAPGRFWFFLDGWTGARRGVDVTLPCRVWQETESEIENQESES